MGWTVEQAADINAGVMFYLSRNEWSSLFWYSFVAVVKKSVLTCIKVNFLISDIKIDIYFSLISEASS